MPSHTPKQARTMAAACHNKKFSSKVGIPQDVACEFNRADMKKKHRKQPMKSAKKRVREALQTLTQREQVIVEKLSFKQFLIQS